ncbi:MAG: hypothetical protein SVM79_09190, partial [Chloroflexota bacterium]|nr:hypothetical protein [Chloroflexota bacterium]
GGRTTAGSRAASSHTGSLAGVEAIWEAVYRQTGVIPADDMDEMADLLVVFTHMSPATGSNVAIIGAGGGASVLATDICERAGLIVPELPENARQKLREFVPEIGASTANPVDAPPLMILNPERVYETMMIVASAPEVDVLLLHMEPHIGAFRQKIEVLEMQADGIIRAANKCGKPVAMVITPAPVPQRAEVSYQLTKKYLGAGLATFPSTARAANAIAKFTRYHRNSEDRQTTQR